jgi:CelD/BcsL family acetyltransferase involved in cellulose biosynthesis
LFRVCGHLVVRSTLHFPARKDHVISELVISLHDAPDLEILARRWRALETRARPSFFQSWSWLGCLAHERFPNAMLLVVQSGGEDVGLALFNRGASRLSPQTLWLGESGIAAFDALYIEHNGVLLARGFEHVLVDCLQALLPHRVVLSGCDDAHLAAARACSGMVHLTQTQTAPYVDLQHLAPGEAGVLATMRAGSRAQLRRSIRRYEQSGSLLLHRATTLADALTVLGDLETLHQASWTARGKPGAFANPVFRRFHTSLIAEALPRGEIELSRVTAGHRLIGCLYHFRYAGTVVSYQSGFAAAEPHDKPGLVCHLLAIADAQRSGAGRYDFLAGLNRGKTIFANAAVDLHWFDLVARWSPRGVIARLGLRAKRHTAA